METPVTEAVDTSGAVRSGGTMAAAAHAAVEELMTMGGPQVVNEAAVGEALKPSEKPLEPSGDALELACPLENDENFMPEGPEGPDDPNYPVRINMDKIRRLQSSLPVDDPLAPLGSKKNPIRIIQQGNQFITTQDLSDDQLKQILQVLRNQALIEDGTETLTSATNSVYNPETSTRIIFRVTNATKALARAQVEETGGNFLDYKPRPRKRPRTDETDSSDPDFDPGVPEEELGPVVPRHKSRRAMRSVRPPKHLVKDYKQIKLSEMDNDFREEESDGGYSDFETRKEDEQQQAPAEDRNDPDWSAEEADTEAEPVAQPPSQQPSWPCNMCGQLFRTKGGLSRHQFMRHGIRALKPKLDLLTGKTRELMPLAQKRRNKLKQALAAASEEDILELALPRLAKMVSPWDFFLSRSEQGSPPLPSITKLLADYMNTHDVFRNFIGEHLEACNINEEVVLPDSDEQPIYVKIDNEEHSHLLHLPCGDYRVKKRLNEDFLPTSYKNVQALMELRERQRKAAWLLEQQQQQQRQAGQEGPQPTEGGSTAPSDAVVGIETLAPDSLANLSAAPAIITDEDLNSGRYLAVLNENGEATDLVLHSGSSLLYHRPTGQQVILLEDGSAATVVAADEVSAAAIESGAVPMETLEFEPSLAESHMDLKSGASPEPPPPSPSPPAPKEELVPLPEIPPAAASPPCLAPPEEETAVEAEVEEPSQEVPEEEPVPEPEEEEEEEEEEEMPRRRRKRVKKAAALKFEDKEDHTITQRSALPDDAPPPGEAGPMTMDVTQLFPGVNVTDLDENTMLIDRGDGRKIQVDHGGHGVTLETFQNLLTLP